MPKTLPSGFQAFADLPSHIRAKVKRLPNVDPKTWVEKSVPALGGKSILEAMNAGEEENVLRVLNRQLEYSESET